MSRKQDIYLDMLRTNLPYLRNVSTWPWWRRLRDRSSYYESQLIHNLCPSLVEPEICPHDIWFLNVEARNYCERCSGRTSPLYAENVRQIKELFAIAAARQKSKLEWSGPE
jgi:hypothetical protein